MLAITLDVANRDGFDLPVHRRGKVAFLGISRGEGIDDVRFFIAGEFAGSQRGGHGQITVTILGGEPSGHLHGEMV